MQSSSRLLERSPDCSALGWHVWEQKDPLSLLVARRPDYSATYPVLQRASPPDHTMILHHVIAFEALSAQARVMHASWGYTVSLSLVVMLHLYTSRTMFDGSSPSLLSLRPPASNNSLPLNGLVHRDSLLSTPQLAHSHFSTPQPGYHSYPETPRTSLATAGFAVSPQSAYGSSMALASQGYGTPSNESHSFPWPTLENEPGVTLTCEGADVTPRIYAKVEKGFFLSPSDRSWTCYRRNYFSVVTSFELHPCIANGRIMLNGNLVRATGRRTDHAAWVCVRQRAQEILHQGRVRPRGARQRVDGGELWPLPGRRD
ncbi:hypothetical protein M8818_003698 [Zalaria obscura]|uniref:Uncharacterized protein n=1 Tax=Zalaria obscura TaxID=2024903 RepID=A0ACC3SIF9_9PEZI